MSLLPALEVYMTYEMLVDLRCVWCRMWAALQACSRCRGVVVIHHERCVMHCGIARTGHQPGTASLGPIAKGAIGRGAPNYLANLILFPGSQCVPTSCCLSPLQ